MEADVSKLSTEEIEGRIKELEHTYVEFFEHNSEIYQLNRIRKWILDLESELEHRREN